MSLNQPEGIEHAKKLIHYCLKSKETFLDLGNCGLHDLSEIPELWECKHLKGLNMGSWFHRRNGSEFETKMTSNNFDKNLIDNFGVELISQGLKQLTYLELRYTTVGDFGIKCIKNKLKRIEYLGLYCTQITINALNYISEMKSLTQLNLGFNKIGPEGAKLIKNNKLIYLDLNACNIHDNGLAFLLSNNFENLKYLNLSSNKISFVGIQSLIDAKPPLTHLILYNNGVSDINIDDLIKSIPEIKYLHLHHNQMSDQGVLKLVSGLNKLETFCVSDNPTKQIPKEITSDILALRNWESSNKVQNNSNKYFPLHKQSKAPKTIFICYSHADLAYRDELDKHFGALKLSGQVDTFHDGKILPGQNWDDIIKSNLYKSDIVLLLLSVDFINSKYIWETELKIAKKEGKTIIPVFLRHCDFDGTGIESDQGVPFFNDKDKSKGMAWIMSDKFHSIDEAFLKVVERVKTVLET